MIVPWSAVGGLVVMLAVLSFPIPPMLVFLAGCALTFAGISTFRRRIT